MTSSPSNQSAVIQGDEAPSYTDCYLAFIDFLGWKSMVERSVTDIQFQRSLVHMLLQAANLPSFNCDKTTYHREGLKCIGIKEAKHWCAQIRSFSDCVVIFIPIETHALPDILRQVRYLHDRAFEMGFCIRGAVTIGPMYWDNYWSSDSQLLEQRSSESTAQTHRIIYDRSQCANIAITIGPALVEAYDLESNKACFPRVIFSNKLISHIKDMRSLPPEHANRKIHEAARAGFLCEPNLANHDRCLLDFIHTDSDGVPFFDLFHADLWRNDTSRIIQEVDPDGRAVIRWVGDGGNIKSLLGIARQRIVQWLKEVTQTNVRDKHLWLAKYFNRAAEMSGIEQIPDSLTSEYQEGVAP